MAKVKVVKRPSGLINTQPWPEVGEEIELPDTVAKDMAEAGWVEAVKVEKRPASKKAEEKR